MSRYETLLFLHVVAAFMTVVGVVAFATIVLASRGGTAGAPHLSSLAFWTWTIGGVGVLVLGIALVLDVDGYDIFDGWIIAAIVLWLVASAAGGPLGRELRMRSTHARVGAGAGDAAPTSSRTPLLVVVAAAATLALILDMIYKPGA